MVPGGPGRETQGLEDLEEGQIQIMGRKIDKSKQLWQLTKAAQNLRARQLTFTLNLKTPNGTQDEDNEGTRDMFRDTFLPKAKPAVLDDTTDYI